MRSIIPIDHEDRRNHSAAKAISRKVCREPGPEDPLFFDQASPRPNFSALRSKKKYGRAYCRPAVVYAMNKTGCIVTETNAQFLTDAELQEWHDGVDEYHQRIESGETQWGPLCEGRKLDCRGEVFSGQLDAAHSAVLHNGKARCTRRLTVGCLCNCRLHLKMYAFSCLQILNDLDKIVSFRVAGRPKHAHETLWINVDSLS